MNRDPFQPLGSPRWLHTLAVLTVLCALPLVFLGASVTSHDVGMVDPRGFRWPWEIVRGLFENNGLGWMLEYGHRTFGFLVGICGIGLAIGCWWCDRRLGLKWLGVLALVLICVQGALGAFRVNLNAWLGRDLALMHGVFAQIVVAILCSLALLTSRRWADGSAETTSRALKLWSLATVFIVFVQLILGALIRHQQDSLLGPRGHLFGAFVVTAAILWLMKLIRESESRNQFAGQRLLLKGLLVLQIVLGIESWLAKFYVEGAANQQQLLPLPMHAEWVRTLHYFVGTLIFATAVAVALTAYRKSAMVRTIPTMPPGEGLSVKSGAPLATESPRFFAEPACLTAVEKVAEREGAL